MSHVIGITGTIGTGKTTVARMLQRQVRGAQLLDADKIAKQFLQKPEIAQQIGAFFPETLTPTGRIDPKKLADAVFAKSAEKSGKLSLLNNLIHPLVVRAIRQKLDELPAKFIILDVPLLVEADMLGIVDYVIIVNANEKTVRARAKKFTAQDIEQRTRHQLSFEEKKKRAEKALPKRKIFIVENSASRPATSAQVKALRKSIR